MNKTDLKEIKKISNEEFEIFKKKVENLIFDFQLKIMHIGFYNPGKKEEILCDVYRINAKKGEDEEITLKDLAEVKYREFKWLLTNFPSMIKNSEIKPPEGDIKSLMEFMSYKNKLSKNIKEPSNLDEFFAFAGEEVYSKCSTPEQFLKEMEAESSRIFRKLEEKYMNN